MEMNVEGKDIIIIDPAYFIEDDTVWQKIVDNLDKSVLGFSNAIIVELSDYHQTEIIDKGGNLIGEWFSDSNLLGCFLLDEVVAYSKQFAKDEENWENYSVIIRNFTGSIEFINENRRFPMDYIQIGSFEEVPVLTIKGIGSPFFETKHVPTEDFL